MRRRRLGVGVDGVEGTAAGVNETTGSDVGEKEEDVVFDLVRNSLDCSQAVKNVGGVEDGLNAGATTTAPLPTSTIKTSRTEPNPLANAYWTTQRAAEAEDYIRDVVYGGVDGLAYVRSLAQFVGDSCLYSVSVFFFF